MVSVDALWQLAINDPHLMRLGEFLARTSGREGSEDELESSFLDESWLSWLKIEQVVEPGFGKRPFVVISGNQLGSHSACPFFALKQKQVSLKVFWIQLSNFCIFALRIPMVVTREVKLAFNLQGWLWYCNLSTLHFQNSL